MEESIYPLLWLFAHKQNGGRHIITKFVIGCEQKIKAKYFPTTSSDTSAERPFIQVYFTASE